MIREDLGTLQRRFALQTAKLIQHIYDSGYAMTYGEAWRTDEQAEIDALSVSERHRVALLTKGEFPRLAAAIWQSSGAGIRASNHRNRLALDLNLFKDGVYLTNKNEYAQFGAWWTAQDPIARYGGNFDDYDHFSFAYEGVQ